MNNVMMTWCVAILITTLSVATIIVLPVAWHKRYKMTSDIWLKIIQWMILVMTYCIYFQTVISLLRLIPE